MRGCSTPSAPGIDDLAAEIDLLGYDGQYTSSDTGLIYLRNRG